MQDAHASTNLRHFPLVSGAFEVLVVQLGEHNGSVRDLGYGLFQQSRALRRRSWLLQERSRLLQERSRFLQERSRDIILRCAELGEKYVRLRDTGSRSEVAAVAPPLTRLNGKPRRNKLVHKNRWLISIDVVASLRRAGVDCNILIPGGEPWLASFGLDPHCRPN